MLSDSRLISVTSTSRHDEYKAPFKRVCFTFTDSTRSLAECAWGHEEEDWLTNEAVAEQNPASSLFASSLTSLDAKARMYTRYDILYR